MTGSPTTSSPGRSCSPMESGLALLPALAADLVGRKVSVIVAALLPAARAAKSATATIPIVFISGSDPIESRLVTTLSRRTENVTGVSVFSVR
jgi:putative tryptophan/tyrosine transport system substrate-binding protein